jgi:hypothetical protein
MWSMSVSTPAQDELNPDAARVVEYHPLDQVRCGWAAPITTSGTSISAGGGWLPRSTSAETLTTLAGGKGLTGRRDVLTR